jgi:ATP-independent RNA helicase DbpA
VYALLESLTFMDFRQLSLPYALVDNLTLLNFHQLRPIQEQSLPIIFKNHDVVVQAPTASGKTLIFAIAALLKINMTINEPQVVIIAPTRELVFQIAKEIDAVGKYLLDLKVTSLVGGEPIEGQVLALERKRHIIVATVGRLMDHLGRGTIDIKDIDLLVLDEADKMLEMGFREDILKIAQKSSIKRQTLLFSATFPNKLMHLVQTITHDTVFIQNLSTSHQREEKAYQSSNKDYTLMQLLSHYQRSSTIVFVNTKLEVQRIYSVLSKRGFAVEAFYGDLTQDTREEIMIRFKNGSIAILVATDIVSRGIDIEGIELIINYDIADKKEIHIHRAGRSGRDGSKALVVTLFKASERNKLLDIVGDVAIDRSIDRDITPYQSSKKTLLVYGGKKDKVRKGDIVGALCQTLEIEGALIGDITLQDSRSFVAMDRCVTISTDRLKIKKRNFKIKVY